MIPVFLSLTAVLITIIGALYGKIGIVPFLKRLSISILAFYLLGLVLEKLVLNDRKPYGKEIEASAYKADEFEELNLPEIDKDNDADTEIRGRR